MGDSQNNGDSKVTNQRVRIRVGTLSFPKLLAERLCVMAKEREMGMPELITQLVMVGVTSLAHTPLELDPHAQREVPSFPCDPLQV